MHAAHRAPITFILTLGLLAVAVPRSAFAQQVAARYVVGNSAAGYVFADPAPGDPAVLGQLAEKFATALKGLTLTIYANDTFALQSGPGSLVFSVAGGRVGKSANGLLFLHFRGPDLLAPTTTVDGVLYPAGADPQAAPTRLSFSLTQPSGTGGVLTWHSVVNLKPAP
jgi:hypothetical protein